MKTKREIKRHRLHQDIVKYLLDDIKNGIYKVGEGLPSERDLMEEFNVGRPSIREALMQLSQMGIIEIRPGVRARVREPSVLPLLNGMGNVVRLQLQNPRGNFYFQEARILFETAVARRAAILISESKLQILSEILKKKSLCLSETEKFAELDVLFHKQIVVVLDNPLLDGVYDAIGRWLLDQRLMTLRNDEQPQKALAAHYKIFEALKNHDPDEAERAMEEHIRQVNTVYSKSYKEEEVLQHG
ncbi:transcriptional regulator NanR [Aminivibrio sp.]